MLKTAFASYQLIRDPDEFSVYLSRLRIRSILNQKLTVFEDKDHCFFPYLMFMVYDVREKSLLEHGPKIMEIDFVNKSIIFSFKDHNRKEYSMSQIVNVIQGVRHDEFVIEFNNKHKKVLQAVYQAQRDLIVKLLIFASESGVNNEHLDEIDNDASESYISDHEVSKLNDFEKEIVKDSSEIMNIKIYMDDLILPPRSLLKAIVKKKNK